MTEGTLQINVMEEMVSEEAAVSAAADDPLEPGNPKETEHLGKWEPLIDTLIVFILAVASVAAAWSGYQSARWSGVQSASWVQASGARVESSENYTYGHQLMLADLDTFTNYVDAYLTNNTEVADFYETHFRPDFRPAFDAWTATDPFNNPDAPISPFVMPEYVEPELQKSAELATQADALFGKGEEANQTSDDYVLNTVFLAAVLFFTAFAPRVKWFPARLGLVIFAVGMFSLGIYHIATYPIH